nr:MAG TPA: hypothetical protein [Caudoviricetes sp.]
MIWLLALRRGLIGCLSSRIGAGWIVAGLPTPTM